jgi:exodeoxyribonuclease VII large subunit
VNSEKRFSLLELNSLVRETIECELPNEYWVEAELSECRESRGHCYIELIQRDEHAATPVARASAKCWASKWTMIRPYFERTTGQQLRAGMKVLLKVYAQFHEAYGFSWIITDIDPNYTLGDQARRRQEIIRQLKEEGIFDLQRELHLPLFCLNIAVISSQTAAGYGDFATQLADSPFAFHSQLFPATMQGEGVEQSVITALNRVYLCIDNFNAVVIIRGGGATSDMSGFDTLALAENVANFPLPIITGIGHDRDESILDMVSHQRVKTPTAAAAFLIDHAQTVLDTLNDAQIRLTRSAQQRLSMLNTQLLTIEQRIPLIAERRLTMERHKLELATERLKVLDPTLLLKRGYSITFKDGHAIRDPKCLHPGDQIETRLEKGAIKSTVI